jgi:predicted DNA-binding protein (UPF0251 family)
MAGSEFFCPYCKRLLPDYFVPLGHGRVPVICFECHIEQQDIHPRKKTKPTPDRVRKILTEKMYLAWKLVCVDGLAHADAATMLGISQQSLSTRLSRAVKYAIRLRGSEFIRGRNESQTSQGLLHQP